MGDPHSGENGESGYDAAPDTRSHRARDQGLSPCAAQSAAQGRAGGPQQAHGKVDGVSRQMVEVVDAAMTAPSGDLAGATGAPRPADPMVCHALAVADRVPFPFSDSDMDLGLVGDSCSSA